MIEDGGHGGDCSMTAEEERQSGREREGEGRVTMKFILQQKG